MRALSARTAQACVCMRCTDLTVDVTTVIEAQRPSLDDPSATSHIYLCDPCRAALAADLSA